MNPSTQPFKTALIAGCGYLGERVARRWSESGVAVSAITRSEATAARFTQNGWNPVRLDLAHPGEQSLPKADVVLWAVGYDRTADASREDVWIDGLQWLLQNLQRPVARFIYISSTSVYGNVEEEEVTESTTPRPVTEGGQCCRRAEQMVLDAVRGNSSVESATVLRMAGIYGPDRLLRRIEDLRQQKPLPGEADHWLNLIHVDDATAMVDWVAGNPETPTVYNVANQGTLTRREYYTQLAELAATPSPVFGGPSASGRPRTANKFIRSQYDFQESAGFQFESVADGLNDAFRRTEQMR